MKEWRFYQMLQHTAMFSARSKRAALLFDEGHRDGNHRAAAIRSVELCGLSTSLHAGHDRSRQTARRAADTGHLAACAHANGQRDVARGIGIFSQSALIASTEPGAHARDDARGVADGSAADRRSANVGVALWSGNLRPGAGALGASCAPAGTDSSQSATHTGTNRTTAGAELQLTRSHADACAAGGRLIERVGRHFTALQHAGSRWGRARQCTERLHLEL